jgi:PII-like signaling protein
MKGVYLVLFMQEDRRHDGRPLQDWLVVLGHELGLPGCSVSRAIAGYGHHGRLHRQGLFELQGTLPVEVAFALDDAQADALLARLRAEGVELFYVRLPAEFGSTTAP